MIETWGAAPDGSPVTRVTIAHDGLCARLISFGAALQDLRLASHSFPLVLGYPTLVPYLKNHNYFGSIVGRYANRINFARASIDGATHVFDKNFLGKHILHGGTNGCAHRNWVLSDHGPDFATFTDALANGHMGFPGCLEINARYQIRANNRLVLTIIASTDQVTLCNLTGHSYFNLDGGPTLVNHKLMVRADTYLPVDQEGIPLSGPMAVANTRFDFQRSRAVFEEGEKLGLDHNFCLSPQRRKLTSVAELISVKSDITLEVSTTEPGLQAYTGQGIGGVALGLADEVYQPFAGIALEPQIWPDAPNRPEFPSAQLLPGETYFHHTEYQFLSR